MHSQDSNTAKLQYYIDAILAGDMKLEQVPVAFRLPGVRLASVKYDGENIRHVALNRLDEDMCVKFINAALAQDGCNFQYLPKDRANISNAALAVSYNANALAIIPNNLKNEEICHLALAKNPSMLAHVPINIITVDMCQQAISQDITLMEYIPAHIYDNQDFLYFIRQVISDNNITCLPAVLAGKIQSSYPNESVVAALDDFLNSTATNSLTR